MSEGKAKLPKGWRWVKLGDIATFVNGRAYSQAELLDNGTPVIRIQNLNGSNHWYYSDLELPPEKYCSTGDLLFAWSTTFGPYIWKGSKSIFHYHIWKVLTSQNVLDKDFAFYLLAQITSALKATSHGSSMPHITKNGMESWRVGLPPLDEQKWIVAVLDEKLAAVEQARVAAQAQLHAAQALPAAYLRAVFESPEARGWPRRSLGNTISLLPAKSIALAGDAEVKAITSACLTERGFNPNGIKIGRMWANDVEVCVVSKGEILIARSNTSELVGRVSIYEGMPSGVVASDLTIRICPSSRFFHPKFLTVYLSYLYLSGYWREKAGGASASMKKITRTQIEGLSVPIPSLEKQMEVSEYLDKKIKTSSQLEDFSLSQLDAINGLPGSLLGQAFRGEL